MLTWVDWAGVVFFLIISIGIGIYASRFGKNTLTDFFLGGRQTSWWLAGLSMVATTFAADTPLAVTEIIAQNGIAGNWLWWNMALGGLLTTFFFARLWYRANVVTDLEIITLRYSGKEAVYLRIFRAFYLGVFLNALIIGWVNLAMMTILQVFLAISWTESLFWVSVLMLLTTIYAAYSGLRGVLFTDAFQFLLAMVGCITLAYLVLDLPEIGGLSGLTAKVDPSKLNFFPSLNDGNGFVIGVGSFFAYIGVQWWASWYPGAEPGGGGYVAQRLMSTKSENDAQNATLLFQCLHYAARPWPWIIVGLAATVLYPTLAPESYKLGYVYAMRDHLPAGLKGMLLASFLAAYMSTLSTQLNWGASYIVNDAYKFFIDTTATEQKLVWVGKVTTGAMMLFSLLITTQLDSIAGAWAFLIECGAGLGLVLILRWYWWRVSAWSEWAATIIPLVVFGFCQFWFIVIDGKNPNSFFQFPNTFLLTVSLTTIGWLLVTYLFPATDPAVLQKFVQQVNPPGFWGKYQTATPSGVFYLLIAWFSGISIVYGILFAVGKYLFQESLEATIWAMIAGIGTVTLRYAQKKISTSPGH